MDVTASHDVSRRTAAVSCRPLERGDRVPWGRLWAAYQRFYRVDLDAAVTETLWDWLLDPDQEPNGFVAIDGQRRVVGIVHFLRQRSTWSIEDQIYLADLYVDPDHRRSGAGRALIRAVDDTAIASGLTRVSWMTQSSNDTARQLYDQLATVTPFVTYHQDLAPRRDHNAH